MHQRILQFTPNLKSFAHKSIEVFPWTFSVRWLTLSAYSASKGSEGYVSVGMLKSSQAILNEVGYFGEIRNLTGLSWLRWWRLGRRLRRCCRRFGLWWSYEVGYEHYEGSKDAHEDSVAELDHFRGDLPEELLCKHGFKL